MWKLPMKKVMIVSVCASLVLTYQLLGASDKMFLGNEVLLSKGNINNNNNNTNNNEETDNDDMDVEIPSDYNAGGFDLPGWKCDPSTNTNDNTTSPSPKHKLIFVHVFKTAGSTFRSFFHSYGEKCGMGVSTILCSSLSSKSLNTFDPNEKWEPCEHKITTTRTKNKIHEVEMSRSFLQNHTDILIGHLPIGIHKNWVDTTITATSTATSTANTQQPNIVPQYIVFFRSSFPKYVSGRLYVHKDKKWTFEEAVTQIKAIIHEQFKNGYYIGYKKYLTTPEQKEIGERMNYTNEKWVSLMKQNIINMPTIVGIIENMSESVELIQSVIDVDQNLTPDLQRLVNPADSSSRVENKSKLSTSEIVRVLKDDPETLTMMNEIFKYEIDLYDFAVKIHHLQVKELRKKHGDKYSFAS